ncbi:MAG: hypothetical protein JSV32_00325 [Dehalococcoidia bacterium]|nr:MAG: hypothetical protein JSV32_00325 [Dehalococcoidia bacterium]
MPYGPTQKFEVGIASGASTSSYMDTGGRYFKKMALHYVTMSTGAMVTVYGSDSSDGTYLPISVQVPGTSTVAYNNLTVATSVSGGWGMFDGPPHRYLQFVTSAVVSGGVSFTIIAND